MEGLGEIGRLRMECRFDINALYVHMSNKVFLKFLIINEGKKMFAKLFLRIFFILLMIYKI